MKPATPPALDLRFAPERRFHATPVRLSKPSRRDDPADAGEAPEPDESGPPRTITGHAAKFNTWTTLYESKAYKWVERIAPGAFANAIKEKQDVRALFNHNADFVLGRTTSGTCRIAEDAQGLTWECDLAPESELVRDLVVIPMDRGDLSQCSFAFVVRSGGEKITIREENDQVIEEREILDVDLYDVSVVTYPAYREAECELKSEGARRAALAREYKRAQFTRNRDAHLRLLELALRSRP